jgi:membrane-bound lytic murein transglycosylase B
MKLSYALPVNGLNLKFWSFWPHVLRLAFSAMALLISACASHTHISESMRLFTEHMVQAHQFDKAQLDKVFSAVEIKDDILQKIAKPAESLPWHQYQKLFLTESKINEGVKFWQQNQAVLAAVEQQYGVPPQIIVAIIGVETAYGKHTGKHRVIDALSTLAFAYPLRSQFFSKELESFLLLCKKDRIDPLLPTGSYAGAMGMPQFMPSSYLAYAIDYNNDLRSDIWHDSGDAIASVANYFVQHGWQKDRMVAFPMRSSESLNDSLKPDLRISELQSLVSLLLRSEPLTAKVKILGLKQERGEELWVTLDNFYVITRYNHSPLYAMAVFQLSQAIATKKLSVSYEQDHTSHLSAYSM